MIRDYEIYNVSSKIIKKWLIKLKILADSTGHDPVIGD